MQEFELIHRYLKPLATDAAAAGLMDDAALLNVPSGKELVITKDVLVEGVHFLPGCLPEVAAARVMGSNLSDIAAMGAVPYGYFLGAALPKIKESWVQSFCGALGDWQSAYGVALLGGDTVQASGVGMIFSCTILGLVDAGCALRRIGAQAGDDVYVSGQLGLGALGLAVQQKRIALDDAMLQAAAIARFNQPEPRITLGRALVGVASSCMDISDGIAGDVQQLARASAVDLEISMAGLLQALPGGMDDAAQKIALQGGDDYELLFTAAPEKRDMVQAAADKAECAVALIGKVTPPNHAEKPAVRWLNDAPDATKPPEGGFEHDF